MQNTEKSKLKPIDRQGLWISVSDQQGANNRPQLEDSCTFTEASGSFVNTSHAQWQWFDSIRYLEDYRIELVRLPDI